MAQSVASRNLSQRQRCRWVGILVTGVTLVLLIHTCSVPAYFLLCWVVKGQNVTIYHIIPITYYVKKNNMSK